MQSLYESLFYAEETNALFTKEASVGYMLKVEAELSKAQAECGIISVSVAKIIETNCRVENIDLTQLSTGIALSGNAAIPLVKQLTSLVKKQDADAAKFVHLGATSQDIVDTALILQLKDAIALIEKQLARLLHSLTNLTIAHRQTLMIGRTLLQHARPITFGLKTAGWMEAIYRTKKRIDRLKENNLVLQLGGAVGSGNEYISIEVTQHLAIALGISSSTLAWHTHRDRLVEIATSLGILTGTLGKIAQDVMLMMQTEIAEVFEGAAEGKGVSSTMPHKRNPVSSTAIVANANRVPHLLASMLSAMLQPHERSPGLWHSEWEVLPQIVMLTSGALEKAVELTATLEVDKQRMLQNIEATNGLIYAESVSLALAPKIGKAIAHEWVEKACKMAITEKKYLSEVLKNQEIELSEEELEELFKPENSIGNSLEIIDAVLKKQ